MDRTQARCRNVIGEWALLTHVTNGPTQACCRMMENRPEPVDNSMIGSATALRQHHARYPSIKISNDIEWAF